MSTADIKPSSRFLRAAEAEYEDLGRQRGKLVQARERTVAALHEIEGALAAIHERELLLSRLAPRADVDAEPASTRGDTNADAAESGEMLRGPAIREAAVQALVRRGGIDAMHYREWFELLTREGYTVAGKDGLAVFLTQLGRSPAVRKTTQSGVYELDREAPQRLTRELERLQGEMRDLTGRAPGTTDLSVIRSRRAQLTSAIGQTERALEEAERVLTIKTEAAAAPEHPLVALG